MSCRKSNHHHSNLIWVQRVLTAIFFIKTVRSTFSPVQRFLVAQHLPTEGQSEGGLVELKGVKCRRCVIGSLLMTVLMVTHKDLKDHKSTQITRSTGKNYKCVRASVIVELEV